MGVHVSDKPMCMIKGLAVGNRERYGQAVLEICLAVLSPCVCLLSCCMALCWCVFDV